MLTIEELMLPRYKVIAPWPEMERWLAKVGDILTEYGNNETTRNQNGDAVPTFEWETFPHLFKPLEWWEDRKPEDMPEYVKDNEGEVIKPSYWELNRLGNIWFVEDVSHHGTYPEDYLPATDAEYLSYTNSLTTKQTD